MKVKALTYALIIILVSTSFLILSSDDTSKALGNEIYVDDSFYWDRDGSAEHPYGSIQSAINLAEEGDTIYVFGGSYNETLVINKKLTIIGGIDDDVSTIYRGKNHRYTIHITADYVTLEGFTVNDPNYRNTVALVYIESGNVVIQRNNISNSYSWGLYFDNSNDSTIGNNIIYNTKGVYFNSAKNNVITNNEVTKCTYSAFYMLSSSDYNIFYGNHFKNNQYGIYSSEGSNINISNNVISDNTLHGIKLYKGENTVIFGNTINDNNGDGIELFSNGCTVDNNTISYNQIGINVLESGNIIKDNVISNSILYGVYLSSGCKNNIFYLNNFLYNSENVLGVSGNYWFYQNQGNYWDDYNNIDKDLNRIGDNPYYIKGGGVDQYPLGYFLKPPSKPSNPSPADVEANVGLSVTLKVKVTDPDSNDLDVYFYNAATDELKGEDHGVDSGEVATCGFTLPFDTVFAWYVVVSDSQLENTSDTWFFSTKQRPPENEKPVADPGGPYTAYLNDEITFDASDSYDPDGKIDFYRWNFGDGTSEILSISPKHTYSSTGQYTVTLTVIDDNGTSSMETIATYILVPNTNLEPVADARGPYTGLVGSVIYFDGSDSYDLDGSIANYTWVFHDGAKAYVEKPTHIYNTAGVYAVSLTVIDGNGSSNVINTQVTIQSPPEESPGFELIIAIISVLAVIIIKRKNKKKIY